MPTISPLTPTLLKDLSAIVDGPFVSLYLPTHRHHPENQQDPIRFRRLVKEIGNILQENHPADSVADLLAPFEALFENPDFWNHTLDGLAMFSAPHIFKITTVHHPLEERVVVAGSFHTKPLRRILQSADRYQILAVNQREIQLYEGDRNSLHRIDPADAVPATMTDALGDELTESHQTVASYGGVGGGSTAMHHGHGGKKDEVEKDAERFFRAVDRAVMEHHSRPSGLPMILAALPEHHHLFHQVSQNPQLLEEGIPFHPDSVSLDELRDLAWQIVKPASLKRLAALTEEYSLARSKGLGLENLKEVAAAAKAGRVASLLIEADRGIPGRIHPGSGNILPAESEDSQIDDLLDDLGELVIQMGGTVAVIPPDQMPTETGAAAVCRY